MKRSAYLCSLELPNNLVSFIREIGYSLIYLDAWGMIKKHLYRQLQPFHWSVFKTTLQCTSFIIWSFAFDRWSLSRVIPSILAWRFKTSMSWKRKKNKGYNIRKLTQGGLLFLWRQRSSLCWNYSPFCIAARHQRKWFLRPGNWYTVAFRALQNIHENCFPRLKVTWKTQTDINHKINNNNK